MIIKQKNSNYKIIEKVSRVKFYIFTALFLIFLILSSILSGAYLYRSGEMHNIYYQFFDIPKIIKNNISLIKNSKETIYIDMDFEAIKRLEYDSKNIGEYAVYNEDNWVNAEIKFKEQKYEAKIRLTGTHNDHRIKPREFSYRIQIKNDKYLLGMREFSILKPSRRSNLFEWVFMKILKDEGLIYHKIFFKNLIINGDSMGFKMVQEQYDKNLIENNNLRDGPIIGFDKDIMFKRYNNNKKNSKYPYSFISTNFFLTAPIKVNREKKYMSNPDLQGLVTKSVDMLELFRQGKIKPSKVFDVDALSKLIAVRVLLSSAEFDWRDIKFYLNPFTLKLVPIGREISSTLDDPNWVIDDKLWWANINKLELSEPQFYNMVLSDPIIYEKFLTEINNYINTKYLENFFNKYQDEINFLEKKLYYNNGYKFPYKNLRKHLSMIANSINNKNSLFIYFNENTKDQVSLGNSLINLNIISTNNFPIKIGCLYLDNIKVFCPSKETIIIGSSNKPLKVKKIVMSLQGQINYKFDINSRLDDMLLNYQIVGNLENNFTKVSRWLYKDFNSSAVSQNKNYFQDLSKIEWLSIDHVKKLIFVDQGHWMVKNTIEFPNNYKVTINKGTSLSLINSSLIFNGPIIFNGTEKSPIKILSSSKSNSSGTGILVRLAGGNSLLNNVIFKNLSKPLFNELSLTGSITFYESDVEINNCFFEDNFNADDYLNIVRSNFSLKNSFFKNTFSDALDSDFSESFIDGNNFVNIGNDSIDYSGSFSKLKNTYIKLSKDKGVSAGERSRVEIDNINIDNSFIGITAKDDSNVDVSNYNTNDVDFIAASFIKKNFFGPAKINFNNYNYKANEQLIVDKNSFINFYYSNENKNNLNFQNVNSDLIMSLK